MTLKIQEGLDLFLGGGLRERDLIHIYGPPSSGKTNIALLSAARAASHGKVVYIDSEGGFSPERIGQIAGDRLNETLNNIILIEPSDFEEQKVAVNKLGEIVLKSGAKLVIVDSISALYRLDEGKDVKDLGRQMSRLLQLARKNDIVVIVTNQIYADIERNEVSPIGGDVIRYWAKISIELDKLDDHRVAILRRHKFLAENSVLRFRVTDGGIECLDPLPAGGNAGRVPAPCDLPE